jgi:membrane-bound metal-dependent hydrolase YbcI (DUF457 family)
MLVAAGVAPDLDYASYLGGAEAFLRFHRTALHSIAGATVMACAVAGVFCAADKKWVPKQSRKKPVTHLRFAPALAVCAIGASGHILLDLASGVGVQLLWPFQAHWSRWNIATNFDPWILFLLLAGLLLPQLFRLVGEEVGAGRKGTVGGVGAIITLVALMAYLGVRANLHGRAADLLLSSEYHGREPLSAGAFPSSSNPFEWRGVVSTDTTIEEINVPLAPGADFNADRSLTHYKPQGSPALDAGRRAADAQRFLKYAQFPFASVARREDGYRVEFRDLRFPSDDTGAENIIVRVDLSSGLQVMRQEFRYADSANP